MEISENHKKNLYRAVLSLMVVLSLYFVMKFFTEFRSYGMMSNQSTITLSGYGEVSAVPDIANVYFTIRKEAATVKEAQSAVVEIETKVLASLKENNVEEKDIKTENASFNPKYEYKYNTRAMMPCTQYGCPPTGGSNVVVGYEAYESINVKVRNTDNVGKIMQDLGALGVSELSGPNFSVDDEDLLKAEARKQAIEDAQIKARDLAKDLGVRLGNITEFNESGDYYPTMMYGKAMVENRDATQSAPAELPKGENTISSSVTITYQIK